MPIFAVRVPTEQPEFDPQPIVNGGSAVVRVDDIDYDCEVNTGHTAVRTKVTIHLQISFVPWTPLPLIRIMAARIGLINLVIVDDGRNQEIQLQTTPVVVRMGSL